MGRITQNDFFRWGDEWGSFWGFQLTGLIEVEFSTNAIADIVNVIRFSGQASTMVSAESIFGIIKTSTGLIEVTSAVALKASSEYATGFSGEASVSVVALPTMETLMYGKANSLFESHVVGSAIYSNLADSQVVIYTNKPNIALEVVFCGLSDVESKCYFTGSLISSLASMVEISMSESGLSTLVLVTDLVAKINSTSHAIGTSRLTLSGEISLQPQVIPANFLMLKCVPFFQNVDKNILAMVVKEKESMDWEVERPKEDVMVVKPPKPKCELKWI